MHFVKKELTGLPQELRKPRLCCRLGTSTLVLALVIVERKEHRSTGCEYIWLIDKALRSVASIKDILET